MWFCWIPGFKKSATAEILITDGGHRNIFYTDLLFVVVDNL